MANQNEQEFFAVVATGRKGLEQMAATMHSELMTIAAEPVRKAGQTWVQRAIVSISNNDNLKEVLATRTGLFSVYKALAKAATMGLQIGGQFPHAHLTPYQGKAELIVSADGYRHAAIHGPGAVLSSVDISRVYEGDEVRIDKGAGHVSHVINPTKERGKLIGIYGIMTTTDGRKIIDYMSRDEALKIRDGHSIAWKNGKGPWKTDEEAMIEKTAAKKFLKRFASEAEGLAMIFTEDEEYTPPARDVSERMADHLEEKVARVTRVKPEDVEIIEEDPAPATEEAGANVELF